MVATRLVSLSATVVPSGSFAAFSASMSVAPSASLVTAPTKPWNWSLRATKSVSQFTSTSAPLVPSATAPTRPSAATRPAFFAAAARPFLRSQSDASCRSPPVSTSAFLQSIIPAPEISRSSLTSAAVISAMSLSFQLFRLNPSAAGPAPCDHMRQWGTARRRPAPHRVKPCSASGVRRLGRFLARSRGRQGFGRQLFRLADILAVGDRLLLQAVQHRPGEQIAIHRDRAGGIVVARHRVGDVGRIGVAVAHRYDRDLQYVGFLDRDLLLERIDHHQDVGLAAHVLDAAERALQLVAVAGEHQKLLLGQTTGV